MNFNKAISYTFFITTFLPGMDKPQSVQKVFERMDADYILNNGSEAITDPTINKDLEIVRSHYAQHNYKIGPVALHFFSEEALKHMNEEGYKASFPAVTNGRNMIHLHKDYEQMPSDERQEALAHEFAHIVINKYPALNPHNWFNKTLVYVPIAAFASANCAAAFHFYYDRKGGCPIKAHKYFKMSALSYAAIVPMFSALHYITNHFGKDDYSSACNIRYSFIDKYEEIMCDAIAASIMPDGGQAGKRLFERRLKKDGDMNGINGSHPWTSTRVAYHAAIEAVQNVIKKM